MQIDNEFKSLIPPLTPDEFSGLEQSLINEGCRDAIVLWNNTIIDGHNRYEICTKHGIEFKTTEMDFTDKTEAKIWIIRNQFGRRNLPTYERSKLALKLKSFFTEKAKENQAEAGTKHSGNQYTQEMEGCQKSDNLPKEKSEPIKQVDTKKELAQIAGVSHDTIAKVEKIERQATPELRQAITEKKVSINSAAVISEMSEKEQAEIVAKGEKEILAKAKEIRVAKAAEKQAIIQQKNVEKIETLTMPVNKPKIHHADCKEFMQGISDNSVDLLFTDPPYSTDIENLESFVESWLPLALSKVKREGRAFICIGAYPKELNCYLNFLLNQDKFIVDNPLIWTYRNTLGVTPNMKYNLNYQVILHLYSEKSRPLDKSVTNEMFSVQDINAPDGRLGNRFHTWQKPDELAYRLIRHTTKENDLILDCFACTGTFIIMADKMKRRVLACDNSLENLKIAEARGCDIITGQKI